MNNVKPITSAIIGRSKKRIPFLSIVETQKQVINIFEWSDYAREQISNRLITNFTLWVCELNNIWYWLMTKEQQEELENCLDWIWDLFNEMNYDKDYFLELLETPITQMNPRQKFNRIFLAYLYRPEDWITTELLRDSLEELTKIHPNHKPLKLFKKYFDKILDAIIHQLENGEIDLKLNYLKEKLTSLDDSWEPSILFLRHE